jgi:hypothetical protein
MSELVGRIRQYLHQPKNERPDPELLLLDALFALESLELDQAIVDAKRSIANIAFLEAAAMIRQPHDELR